MTLYGTTMEQLPIDRIEPSILYQTCRLAVKKICSMHQIRYIGYVMGI